MPTTVTKSVGSAVGRDYASITSWEAQNLNLVTLDQLQVGEMYNDSLFNESVIFAGWNTDATRYITLKAASGHEHGLVRGAGVLVSPNDVTTNLTIINLGSGTHKYTRLTGFSIGEVTLTNSGGTGLFLTACAPGFGSIYTFTRLLLYDFNGVVSSTGSIGLRGVFGGGTGTSIAINCVAMDFHFSGAGAGAGTAQPIFWSFNAVTEVYNCTVLGAGNLNGGATAGYGCNSAGTHKNNLSFVDSGGSGYVYNGVPTQDSNTSSDATASGANAVINATASDYFTDAGAGTEDPTLKVGSPAIDTGVDLSGLFTDDAKGTTRPQGGAWDRGAHEAPGTGQPAIRRFGGCRFARELIGIEGVRVY